MNITAISNADTSNTVQKSGNSDKFISFNSIIEEMSESGEISFEESDLDQTGMELLGHQIILPTMKNVATLASGMEDIMDGLFAENGLPKDPPVELEYSYAENKVKVSGDRDDIAEIEELINADPEIKEYTRSFLAISSTAMAIQESLEFQEEYRNSNNPEAIVAKYSYLFNDNRKYAEASYMYGTDSALLADGVVYSDLEEFINGGGNT